MSLSALVGGAAGAGFLIGALLAWRGRRRRRGDQRLVRGVERPRRGTPSCGPRRGGGAGVVEDLRLEVLEGVAGAGVDVHLDVVAIGERLLHRLDLVGAGCTDRCRRSGTASGR